MENQFRKSSFSGGNGGQCVEVAMVADRVLVRHSKNPDGGTLEFTLPEWDAFVKGVKGGEFDLS